MIYNQVHALKAILTFLYASFFMLGYMGFKWLDTYYPKLQMCF
jgi:hypothetical protein